MVEVTAIICIRGDGHYLANCLRHLVENQITYYLIDNGLDEVGREVVGRREFKGSLVGMSPLEYEGAFALRKQIEFKQRILEEFPVDWVVHLDVDEIMHSYSEGETLRDAIGRLDADGASVINFEEFVFIPVAGDYQPDISRAQDMRHYYFFAPSENRLQRALKTSAQLRLAPEDAPFLADGHVAHGDKIIAAETFALRHYIFRDRAHALCKYVHRVFAQDEIAHGWHANRLAIPAHRFEMPNLDVLNVLPDPTVRRLERFRPHALHYWQW